MPQRCAFFGDCVLSLSLRADEEDRAALGRDVRHEVGRFAIQLGGASEVQDVDAVSLAEDVGLHLRIPALGLVAEVDSGFQQVLHRDRVQAHSTPLSSNVC
jgi:hypothetical protein